MTYLGISPNENQFTIAVHKTTNKKKNKGKLVFFSRKKMQSSLRCLSKCFLHCKLFGCTSQFLYHSIHFGEDW